MDFFRLATTVILLSSMAHAASAGDDAQDPTQLHAIDVKSCLVGAKLAAAFDAKAKAMKSAEVESQANGSMSTGTIETRSAPKAAETFLAEDNQSAMPTSSSDVAANDEPAANKDVAALQEKTSDGAPSDDDSEMQATSGSDTDKADETANSEPQDDLDPTMESSDQDKAEESDTAKSDSTDTSSATEEADTAKSESASDGNNVSSETETAAEPEGPTDPVVKLVLKSLEKARGSKETEALQSLYNQADRTAFWVKSDGFTDVASQTMTEIESADDWGLRASAFRLPSLSSETPDEAAQADAELTLMRAVLAYARHAKGGRVSARQLGSQLEKDPKLLDPKTVLANITSTADPAAYLRSLHPKHPQFVKLHEKLLELKYGKGGTVGPKIPAGPVLKLGVQHEQVALLRKRLGLESTGDGADEFDETVDKAVKDFQSKKGIAVDGIVGSGTRKILNGGTGGSSQINKIVLNMERWRWLPDNLYGDAGIYVWSNIPEFWVRIMKKGDDKPAFSNRTIVGLTDHKTPIFSDEMEWIEIHPTWYVPNSIKVGDILPSLKRATSTVMQRYNLKLNCGSLGSNPKTINWEKVNITSCEITQPPGPKSVLGDFKFKFPNKHSVYMHDTHKPELFSAAQRTFSHGCMRIKDPRDMAKVLLEHQNIMTGERLDKILKGPTQLHRAKLPHHVPVHITYFTMVIDENGKLISRPDVYGHDARLAAVLGSGSYVQPEAAKPAVAEAAKPAAAAEAAPAPKKPAAFKKKKKTAQQENNWWDDILGGI